MYRFSRKKIISFLGMQQSFVFTKMGVADGYFLNVFIKKT